jgi:hypothetical protein
MIDGRPFSKRGMQAACCRLSANRFSFQLFRVVSAPA